MNKQLDAVDWPRPNLERLTIGRPTRRASGFLYAMPPGSLQPALRNAAVTMGGERSCAIQGLARSR